MTVKDAKEYLSKAYRIDQRINAKLEQMFNCNISIEKLYAVNVNLNLTFSYTIYQMGHINSTIVFNNRINRIHTITKCHFLRCNVSISDN